MKPFKKRSIIASLIFLAALVSESRASESSYRFISTAKVGEELSVHRGIVNEETEKDLAQIPWGNLSQTAWFPKIATQFKVGDSFRKQVTFTDAGLPPVDAVANMKALETISFSRGDAILCSFSIRGEVSNDSKQNDAEIESVLVEAQGMTLLDAVSGRALAGRAHFTRKFVQPLWIKFARAGESVDVAWAKIP